MKLFLKIILYTLLIVITSLSLFIAYLVSDYNSSYDQNDINSLVENAKASQPLPEDFIDVYYQINEKRNTKAVLISRFLDQRFERCPCLELGGFMSYIVKEHNIFKANKFVLAMKLEKQLTQDDCLNYLTKRFDFLYMNKSIRQASQFYFNKTFEDLNTKEYASLVIMMKNPSLYNPRKRPEKLESKLKALGFE